VQLHRLVLGEVGGLTRLMLAGQRYGIVTAVSGAAERAAEPGMSRYRLIRAKASLPVEVKSIAGSTLGQARTSVTLPGGPGGAIIVQNRADRPMLVSGMLSF
jgi:hypothetical protein